jgi:hypothetical protein
MKRHISYFALCLMFSLTACVASGGDEGSGNNNNNNTTPSDTGAPSDVAVSEDAGPAADTASPVEDTSAPITDDVSAPAQDTAAPQQPGGLICPAITACINAEMQKICPPTGATQECQTQAINTCVGMASPAEGQLFNAMFQCQMGCAQQNQGFNAGAFACMEQTCGKTSTACYSANVYGAANCQAIDACSQGCQLDASGECARACFQGSSEAAGMDYFSIQFCAQGACAAQLNTPGQDACLQAALQPGGACEAQVSVCTGQ